MEALLRINKLLWLMWGKSRVNAKYQENSKRFYSDRDLPIGGSISSHVLLRQIQRIDMV